MKFAVIGTGFWANYQIPAWKELEGVELVSLYNRTKSKAEVFAQKYDVPNVYDNAETLLENESIDFVDIITDVDTHYHFTKLAAEKGIHVICQKPMAASLEQAREMVQICKHSNVKLFIHENFRWQAPIRALKQVLDSGIIGKPFNAVVTFTSAFPVFENQPFLAELEQFILTDIGSHILDVCRFLFGEAASLYCHTSRVNPEIKGEDVANVMMRMKNGISCYAEMSYASILEKEAFPQTLVRVEGEHGSLVLTHDFILKTTTRKGTTVEKVEPVMYPWLDPDYAVVHSSIVDCNKNILEDLRGTGKAETTGTDNFETIRLIYASYESTKENKVITL